jgi:hypothetical protein
MPCEVVEAAFAAEERQPWCGGGAGLRARHRRVMVGCDEAVAVVGQRLLEAVHGVVDAGLARQGLGRWWAGRLGLLLIPTLFSPPSAFLLPRAGFRGGAVLNCELLAGFASSGGRRALRQASPSIFS